MYWSIIRSRKKSRSQDDAMNFEQLKAQDIIYALAASPNFARDGVCFAGRASGLYRSDDGGESWAFQYETLEPNLPLTTTAIAVSPNFGRDSTVFPGFKAGILRPRNAVHHFAPP